MFTCSIGSIIGSSAIALRTSSNAVMCSIDGSRIWNWITLALGNAVNITSIAILFACKSSGLGRSQTGSINWGSRGSRSRSGRSGLWNSSNKGRKAEDGRKNNS